MLTTIATDTENDAGEFRVEQGLKICAFLPLSIKEGKQRETKCEINIKMHTGEVLENQKMGTIYLFLWLSSIFFMYQGKNEISLIATYDEI